MVWAFLKVKGDPPWKLKCQHYIPLLWKILKQNMYCSKHRVKSEKEQCFRSVRLWLCTKQNQEHCSSPSSTGLSCQPLRPVTRKAPAESSGWRTEEPLRAMGKQPLRQMNISGRFFTELRFLHLPVQWKYWIINSRYLFFVTSSDL